MQEITVPLGDYGYNLAFNCQTYSGDAKDLSGYAVGLCAWQPGTPSVITVSGACSVTSTLAGTVTYTVADGNFQSSDRYYAALTATYTGVKESFETFVIKVTERP